MIEVPPPSTAPAPFISVIVPVYNDAARLRLCLAALERQGWPAARYEVLVVDNGSTPPLELATGEFPHARLLREPTPGVGAARRAGLAAARGELLAFTDADCLPADDWLERGAAALAALPHGGLVGGRIAVVARDPARPTLAESLSMALHFRQQRFLRHGHWAVQANLFTWRHVFEAVGPPKATLFHCEEIEWGRRVHAAGYGQAYAPDAVVYHPARARLAEHVQRAARLETGWQELRRAERVGTGPRAWLAQYLAGPLSAIGTDVLADRALGAWPRRVALAALALFLVGVRLVAWAGQSLAGPPDARATWG